jgi:hypothetical protein
MAWRDVPSGAYVEFEGAPHVVLVDRLRLWSPEHGYGGDRMLPRTGDAVVLTPELSIYAISNGYKCGILSTQRL